MYIIRQVKLWLNSFALEYWIFPSNLFSTGEVSFWFLCFKRCIFSRGDSRNFVVIHGLMKASTIPVNVKKMCLSLAFSDLAVGLLPKAMAAIIHAVILKMVSSGENLASFCPTVLSVHYYFSSLLATASFLNVIVIAVDRLHLRYQELITPKRVTKVLLFVWLTRLVVSSPLCSFSFQKAMKR